MTTTSIAEAGRRRDIGLARAAAALPRRRLILGAQIAMLDVLLARPDGTVTTDDLEQEGLGSRRPQGGKWLGAAVTGLRAGRITRLTGYRRSVRVHRHRGVVGVWAAAADPDTLRGHRAALAAELAALPRPDHD